jgi:hypothetical protein
MQNTPQQRFAGRPRFSWIYAQTPVKIPVGAYNRVVFKLFNVMLGSNFGVYGLFELADFLVFPLN